MVDHIRIDAVFHRLRDVKPGHEFLNAIELFRWNGFQDKAKIMMGPIGDAIAHDAARLIAVVSNAKHARGKDRNLFGVTPCSRGSFTNLRFANQHAQIESSAQNHAVGAASGELQSLGPRLKTSIGAGLMMVKLMPNSP